MRYAASVFCVCILCGCIQGGGDASTAPKLEGVREMKVLFVVAQKDFRDEEYLTPKGILERAHVAVRTASPDGGVCEGMLGAKVKADMKISDANYRDYDAIVVVGGAGSPKYLWGDSRLQSILKSAYDDGKVVAGICLSGAVLAKAGVLEGKRATVFETPETLKALREGGAEYVGGDLVVDGKVITASGPQAVDRFGQNILNMLEQ
ncbi:MAG: DJ-1/PfpI family protein [Candidatus Altiarchaeota archaeon]